MTPAVSIDGLSKTYRIRVPGERRRREVSALDDVRLEVAEGEVFGVVGRNGAGKSTLLKILSRIVSPTSGRAVVRGRVAALLEVGTGMHPEMTGRENVLLNGTLLGMSRDEVRSRLDAIVDFAGVEAYLDTPIKRYSSGMRLRLAFAVAAHLSADILVVDEVLAVGDAEFQSRCLGAMRAGVGSGRTTLFVSHNMAAVERLCDRVCWLEDGRVRLVGEPSEVVTAYLSTTAGGDGMARDVTDLDGAVGANVRFLRVAVAGEGNGAILQGEDVVVRADLEVSRPVRTLQVLLSLTTLEGDRVLATRNGDLRSEWRLEPGRYRVTVTLRDVRLLPRHYRVSLRAFEDRGRQRYQELESVVGFDVQARDVLGTGVQALGDRGVTWTPATFEVEPADGASP